MQNALKGTNNNFLIIKCNALSITLQVHSKYGWECVNQAEAMDIAEMYRIHLFRLEPYSSNKVVYSTFLSLNVFYA